MPKRPKPAGWLPVSTMRTRKSPMPSSTPMCPRSKTTRTMTTKPVKMTTRSLVRGRSSVGRALQWHCRGQGFDSPRLHQALGAVWFEASDPASAAQHFSISRQVSTCAQTSPRERAKPKPQSRPEDARCQSIISALLDVSSQCPDGRGDCRFKPSPVVQPSRSHSGATIGRSLAPPSSCLMRESSRPETRSRRDAPERRRHAQGR
jgi:hypothetical protein